MDLRTKTVRGIGWSATSQMAKLLIQLFVFAVLARLLTPSDFGLIAMVVVFSSFVAIFSDFGLGFALVQKREIDDTLLSSVFWINVVAGLLLTLSLALLAPLIALFFSEQALIPIVVLISTTFFISSFGTVQMALLMKRMDFKSLGICSILSVGISGGIAIFLAYSGYGVSSLAWNTVIAAIVAVILYWTYSRWIPRLTFSRHQVGEVLGFGLNLTGFSFVNYFSRNLDNLLIGRFLGAASLGFYSLAYNLLILPISNISDVVGRVMFPALSSIQDDLGAVREAYLNAARYVAAVGFPVMVWLVISAPQVIAVVYGPQWDRSILLLQILAFVGIVQSVAATVGWIYTSQGRTDTFFRWGVLAAITYAISFAIGLHWNLEGVAVAYAIAGYIIAYPGFFIAFKLINLKFSYFLLQLKSIILATFTLGVIAFTFRVTLEAFSGLTGASILVTVTAISALTYLGLIYALDRDLFIGIRELVKEFVLPRGKLPQDQSNK